MLSLKSSLREIRIDIDKIAETIIHSMPEIDFEMSEQEKQNYYDFVRIMAEIEWPAYLDGNYDFHKQITELYKKRLFDEIKKSIYNRYN